MSVAQNFADCAERWFIEANVSDATKKLRRSYYNRDIYPAFKELVAQELIERTRDVRAKERPTSR